MTTRTLPWTYLLVSLSSFLQVLEVAALTYTPSNHEDLGLSKALPVSIKIEGSRENQTSSSDCPLTLSLTFFFNKTWHKIQLDRESGFHGNRIPVFLSNSKNIVKYNHNMTVHLCHYIDIHTSATFSVQKAGSTFLLDGHFRSDGNLYAIKSKESKIKQKSSSSSSSSSQSSSSSSQSSSSKYTHYIQHLSSGDIHRPPPQSSRQKRQAKTQYNVGVLVVVDSAIFKRWYAASNATTNSGKTDDAISNIRYYFSHIMNEVNMRYQSIQDTDYNLNVYLVGFHVAQNNNDSPWTEEAKTDGDKINVFDVILKFRQWVNQRASQLPAFDHAILFTGNDLYAATQEGTVTTATTGQSYVGGICRYDKVSVVEDKSRFKSSTTAAHEIAHNLGAGHDGQDNSCSASAQYIMTPLIDERTPDNYYNIFTFSSCSKNELKRSLTSIAEYNNCLEDRPNLYDETEWRKFLELLPGQKYSYDIQCQNIYGEGAYFCGTQTYGDKICQRIPCYNPKKDDCYIPSDIAVAQGTTCGDKKWCDGGQCVRDDRAPSVNPDCIYGDYRGRLLNKSVTCEGMIAQNPHYCYHQTNRELCCASCAKLFQQNNAGCEYGDRADWCKSLSGRQCELNAEVCCATCKTPVVTDPDCIDKEPDTCRTMEKHECYLSHNREKCCKTCERIKRELKLSAACPYGDKDPSCRGTDRIKCYYYGFTELDKCCETCKKDTTPGCPYGDRIQGCKNSEESCAQDAGQCCGTCNLASKKIASTLLLLSLSLSSIFVKFYFS